MKNKDNISNNIRQSTQEVLMIEPIMFYGNEETSSDNIYQKLDDIDSLDSECIQSQALHEFWQLVNLLRGEGINVHLFQDTIEPPTPDSIFPNNWFSTHDGLLTLYPMYAKNRQSEIMKFKEKIIDLYKPKEIYDLSPFALQNRALESTGAIVFDHLHKMAYSVNSKRNDVKLLKMLCFKLGYKPFPFHAYQDGSKIYHTNLLMSVTSELVFICKELVDPTDSEALIQSLSEYHQIIDLTPQQIRSFAGNVLELTGQNGSFLLLSKTAYDALELEQIHRIEQFLPLRYSDVSTIEKLGGGSVRCMVAELFF